MDSLPNISISTPPNTAIKFIWLLKPGREFQNYDSRLTNVCFVLHPERENGKIIQFNGSNCESYGAKFSLKDAGGRLLWFPLI